MGTHGSANAPAACSCLMANAPFLQPVSTDRGQVPMRGLPSGHHNLLGEESSAPGHLGFG